MISSNLFWIIVITILILSFILSLISLRRIMKTKNSKELRETREELKKGKVVFQDPNSQSSSS